MAQGGYLIPSPSIRNRQDDEEEEKEDGRPWKGSCLRRGTVNSRGGRPHSARRRRSPSGESTRFNGFRVQKMRRLLSGGRISWSETPSSISDSSSWSLMAVLWQAPCTFQSLQIPSFQAADCLSSTPHSSQKRGTSKPSEAPALSGHFLGRL